MKTKTTRCLLAACLLCILGLAGHAQVCNTAGDLMLFTNYDGGTLTINVDQNIANLKIGVCSYEGCKIILTGPFVNNVTAVRYAGFNGSNAHCGGFSNATSITGAPGGAVTSTVFAPPVTLANSNGYSSIICGYSCSNSTSQGGCNTVDQVEAYFLGYFPGSALFAHKVQYGCWTGTQSVSIGGSCCPPPPVYPGTIAASQPTVCAGSIPGPLSSSASATVSTGTVLYQWQSSASPSSGFSNIASATSAGYAPPALSSTTYYRRAASTSTANVVYSNTVSISVTPLPVISISGPASVCAGASATLTASGGTNYTWSSGNAGATVVVTPTVSGALTVTCFPASGGCSTTATKNITVLPLPAITASASAMAVCAGSSTTLEASGGSNYSWLPGSLSGSAIAVTPAASESYTVTGTGPNGCSDVAVINIMVNPLPPVQITGTGNTACSGTTVSLAASGAVNYTWMPGAQTAASVTFTATANITYTLTGEFNGCYNTATQAVTVVPSPVIAVIASRSLVCAGEAVTLSASGGESYAWSSTTATGSVTTVNPAAGNSYSVTGTAANGCKGQAVVAIAVAPCTGIELQQAGMNGLVIFPNPNTGDFTISAGSSMTLAVLNSAGQHVRSIQLNAGNGYKASVSGLGKGIYFVISGDRAGVKQKIVVE